MSIAEAPSEPGAAPSRRDYAALALLVTGSGLAGAARCLGSSYPSLAMSIPDDAYYYLLPAWNVGRVGFFTFDGTRPTFGFQPLWACVLAGIGALSGDREGFLRAALLTTELLHAATAAVIAGIGWRLGGRAPAVLAGGMFLSNVAFLRISTTGMEPALYGLLLSVSVLLCVVPAPSAVRGVLVGLLPFARLTPSSVAVTVALAALAWWRPVGQGPPRRLGGALALLATLAAGLCAERYFLGHWLPTSGTVKLAGWMDGLRALDGAGQWRLLRAIVGYPVNQLLLGFGLPSAFGYADNALYCVPVVLVASTAASRARWRSALVPAALLTVALVAAMAVPVLLNRRGIELYYYAWYATEAPVLVPLVLAAGVGALRRGEVVALAFAASLAAAVVVRAEQPRTGTDPGNVAWGAWQRAMWAGAERADAIVPEGAPIGAFNAGLLGYASRHPVVNLDGLANDEVIGTTSVYDYLRSEHVEWMVDAMPVGGWFGPDHAHVDVVETIPFAFPGFESYCIARVVTESEFTPLQIRTPDEE